MSQMNISLRAGEKLYINGAVLRVDRKATIELLNDVTFLLESHVIQVHEASTPLRQIYFAVQVMLMDPNTTASATALTHSLIKSALSVYQTTEIVVKLRTIADLVDRARYYESLKMLRALYSLEHSELFANAALRQPNAA